MRLCLGPRSYDVTTRALVVAVLGGERLPGGLLRRAEQLVGEGAEVLEVDAAAAEHHAAAAAVAALTARFDVAVSVRTCLSPVVFTAVDAGAVLADASSGVAAGDYLHVVAAAGASVVVGDAGRAPPPAPAAEAGDDTVVAAVTACLRERAGAATAAGIPPERVLVAPGAGARDPEHALALVRASDRLAALGHALVLSASGDLLAAPAGAGGGDHRPATLAAVALGVTRGARLVRTEDVKGARRVCDVVAAVLEAA